MGLTKTNQINIKQYSKRANCWHFQVLIYLSEAIRTLCVLAHRKEKNLEEVWVLDRGQSVTGTPETFTKNKLWSQCTQTCTSPVHVGLVHRPHQHCIAENAYGYVHTDHLFTPQSWWTIKEANIKSSDWAIYGRKYNKPCNGLNRFEADAESSSVLCFLRVDLSGIWLLSPCKVCVAAGYPVSCFSRIFRSK